jgi:hypothetical protein
MELDLRVRGLKRAVALEIAPETPVRPEWADRQVSSRVRALVSAEAVGQADEQMAGTPMVEGIAEDANSKNKVIE